MTNEKFNFLEKIINPQENDKILNIGIGWEAKLEGILEDKVGEMWTADIDIKKLKNANKILKKTKIIFLDAEKRFNLKEKYFDKVILLEVLEHLKNDFNALKNINRILKKDGELIISVPTRCFNQMISLLNWFVHYRHYSKKGIVNLLKKSNFEIVSIDFVGNWIASLNLYLSLFLKYFLGKKLESGDVVLRKQYGKSWAHNRNKGMSILIKAKKV